MTRVKFIIMMLIMPFLASAQSIDAESSYVSFDVSNMMVRTVKGTIKGMQGKVIFDEKSLNTASFDVCVDVSTIDTKSKKRDDHLKNEDYFHVEKYPTICFRSDDISEYKDGYLADGQLTMHGVTKDVQIPFTYTGVKFHGTLKVKRHDYGIGSKGGFMIGKEVQIEIVTLLKN